MAVNAPVVLRADEGVAHLPLPRGPALHLLCGMAWLLVAWAFSFLDRALAGLVFFMSAWLVVGALGFGLALRLRGDDTRARKAAAVLTLLAGLLTLFPGFMMFTLVRWLAFGLLLVTAARAPAMRTRRDLYYALAATVAVSLLVVTHHNAQWTIWFYLGPAWLCMAYALAWDYAAEVPLGGVTKAGLTTGFLVLAIAAGMALAALLPVPRMLGFGFLPPGTDHPGRVERPAGAATQGDSPAGGRGEGGSAGTGASASALGDIVQRLHEALQDPGLPAWQRSVVRGLLATAEGLARATGNADGRILVRPMTAQERAELQARAAALARAIEMLWQALLLALLAWLLWRWRWRMAGAAALEGAGLLVRVSPALAMRCAMLALRVLLRRHGHALQPGESLLEHVASAAMLPPPVRDWLLQAVRRYGAWRFGGTAAASADAAYVRQAVVATSEVLRERRAKR